MHSRRVGMITMIALGGTIPPYIGIRSDHRTIPYQDQASTSSFLRIRSYVAQCLASRGNPIMERMVIAGFSAKNSSRKGVYRNRNRLNLSTPFVEKLGISFPSPCSFYPVLLPPEILIVLQDGPVLYHGSGRTGRILKIQCLDLGSLLHHALSPSIPPVWP